MPRTPHSPGPWTVNPAHPFTIECPTDIPGVAGRVAAFGFRPNAERAAACVNALDGIDDPATALAEVRRRLVDVRRALTGPLVVLEAGGCESSETVREAREHLAGILALLGGKP